MFKKVILYTIVSTVTVVLLYTVTTFLPVKDNRLEEKINKLEHLADSLLVSNRQLDQLANLYIIQADNYKKDIERKNLQITQLRKDVEKSTIAIDTASYYELVKFFSDRYDSSFIAGTDSSFND
jgi:hypothetical protein